MIRTPAERGLLTAIAKEQLKDSERLVKMYPEGTWEGRIYIFQDGQYSLRSSPSATFDEISDASGLSEGRTYQILRELKNRRLISIEEGYEHDGEAPRRCWQYRLTDQGRRALKEEDE